MTTFEQHRQRLEQVLKTNRALMETLAYELGEAMRLYTYIPTEHTQAKVYTLEQAYNTVSNKVETITAIYEQFLKDGKAPEWL
jgi:hypothetical protein